MTEEEFRGRPTEVSVPTSSGSEMLLKTPQRTMSALDRQVGEGAYTAPYRDFPIQPAEFCHKNGLSWCAANVVKYVCRHQNKNGMEDLRKAHHYLQMLAEFHYNETL